MKERSSMSPSIPDAILENGMYLNNVAKTLNSNKWFFIIRCINKTCVRSNDVRLQTRYPATSGGGVQLHCNEAACHTFKMNESDTTATVSDEVIERSLHCPVNCSDTQVMNAFRLVNSFTLRYLSCTNPLPVNSSPTCFDTEGGEIFRQCTYILAK